jgi:GxxExxY protein
MIEPRMDTNGHERAGLLHGQLVYSVVGCAFEVLREVGHGLHENPYEKALVVEFGLRKLRCDQQRRFPVFYKNVQITEYVPDLLVENSVVVDAKVIDRITDHERGQMLNYLRITKLRVGLIINFKHAKLEWERVVL